MLHTPLLRKAWRYWRNYGLRAFFSRLWVWLRWRFFARASLAAPAQWVQSNERGEYFAALGESKIRLVIFDVFDTLLCRPLLDAESIKELVGRRLGVSAYAERRVEAEEHARAQSGHDVTLAEICQSYVALFGAGDGSAADLQAAEEYVERRLVRVRKAFAGLPAVAQCAGKRVVLASDMFLSAECIRNMLLDAGVVGFDRLYVSSAHRARKSDNGALYHHILAEEGCRAEQALMVGDNAESDQRIPAQIGLATVFIASQMARLAQMPRFQPWQETGLALERSGQLWPGLIAQKFFGTPAPLPPFCPHSLTQNGRTGIGYAVVGPLLVAFCQWLQRTAEAENIDTLYFLAREGQLIEAVFRILYPDHALTRRARYLVLSRRAVSVAMIESEADIEKIAAVSYNPNTLQNFIFHRFGVTLDAARMAALEQAGVWSAQQLVRVEGGNISALRPVLQALADDIFQQAQAEKPAMLAYLANMGLHANGKAPLRAALVDVGYSGSIQDRLNVLLSRPVHGLYMATRIEADQVRQRHQVTIRGCFAEDIKIAAQSPLLCYNVPLEMLMGSNDAQISSYRQQDDGSIVGQYQFLSPDEQNSVPMRSELRAGALQFAHDYARLLHDGIATDIKPADTERFFVDFWEKISAAERNAIADIAADDHYCGMGVVHFSTFMAPP